MACRMWPSTRKIRCPRAESGWRYASAVLRERRSHAQDVGNRAADGGPQCGVGRAGAQADPLPCACAGRAGRARRAAAGGRGSEAARRDPQSDRATRGAMAFRARPGRRTTACGRHDRLRGCVRRSVGGRRHAAGGGLRLERARLCGRPLPTAGTALSGRGREAEQGGRVPRGAADRHRRARHGGDDRGPGGAAAAVRAGAAYLGGLVALRARGDRRSARRHPRGDPRGFLDGRPGPA